MFKLKYKKYNYYKPRGKRSSILRTLNKEYEEVFLKILNKEDLTNEEDQIFLKGFDEVKSYLVSSLLRNIEKKYESKKPIEQKMSTLYNQYKYLYPELSDFMYRIREDLETLCEGSIYSAIGFGNNSFNKQDRESNLILFISNSFFYDVLNFLEKNVNSLNNEKFVLNESIENNNIKEEDNYIKIIEIEELLKEKNIKESVGEDMYNEIKEVLINENSIPEHLIEIIKYIKL